jgi:hypothetical protein
VKPWTEPPPPSAAPAAYGVRSDDGLWWWDGQAWQSVPTPEAPRSRGQPSRWQRLIPYALVLYVGLLCAEYVSSSTPVPVVQPESSFVPINILAYGPFYLVLLLMSARWGPLSFRTYYIFGALLGLTTETAITDVVWGHNETLKPILGVVGGFGIWEVTFLVFTYHPVFSTAVPFLVLGHYFGLAVPALMGSRTKAIVVYGLPVYTAIVWASGSKPVWLGALAAGANAAILTVLIASNRRFGARPRFVYGPLSWALVIALIALIWIVGVVGRYAPAPPTLIATLIGIGLLAWLSVRSARLDSAKPHQPADPMFAWRPYFLYLVYFSAVFLALLGVLGLVVGASQPVGDGLFLVFELIPGVLGTIYLIVIALRVILARLPHTPGRPPAVQSAPLG